jgi:hypothetical protein
MDEKGLEFTARRVTVSTCGIAPMIRELGNDVKVNLAVSLHAADDATRSRLMPINKTYGVDALLDACRDYPLAKNRVILVEYILLKGINVQNCWRKNCAISPAGLICSPTINRHRCPINVRMKKISRGSRRYCGMPGTGPWSETAAAPISPPPADSWPAGSRRKGNKRGHPAEYKLGTDMGSHF